MGIRLKFNLVMVVVAVVGIGLFALISWPFLREQARDEVHVRALIMIASADAIRAYTAEEVAPLLSPLKGEKFDRQAVSSYAVVKNLAKLRTQFPDFSYREAALNPFNQTNRAVTWEMDIIREFKTDPAKKELLTERSTPIGQVLNFSRPIVAEQSCLRCHESSDVAPLAMIALYGRQNGFGFSVNEVMGAEIVSIPMAVPLANAVKALCWSLLLLAAVFALLIIVANLLINFAIIRPVLRMSRVAQDVSMGKEDVEEYVKRGSDEVASLSASLNRMRRSLDESIKLLSAPKS